MRLRERDFWTAADASRGTTTSGYERFGRGGGHGNATRWNILLVHPCISPSISLIKRSLLDNFQPRPSLSFIFCSSHFLFPPPPHHPPSLPFNFRSIRPHSLSPPRLWTRSYRSTHEHKATTRVLPESTLRPRLD